MMSRRDTRPIPYYYHSACDGIGDYWRCTSGVSATGVGWTMMCQLRRDANGDRIMALDDGSTANRFALIVNASGQALVIGSAGGTIKQQITSDVLPSGAGNECLVHAYYASGGDSRVYVDGADETTHVTSASWAGPSGIDRITIGSDGAGNAPLLGRLLRAAVHHGAVDPALVWALRNRPWDHLGLDHVWLFGDGPRDGAATIYDEGVVGGWDLSAVGSPTVTYARTLL